MRNRAHIASTSASVLSGEQVTGSVTMPASDRLTVSTCPACSATGRLRCSTPMPPARAIAIAIRDSVTVSIAELTRGTFSRILRVSWLEVSAVAGTTSEAAGSSRTSSNVSPSIAILVGSSPPVGTGTAMGRLLSAIDMGEASSGADRDSLSDRRTLIGIDRMARSPHSPVCMPGHGRDGWRDTWAAA